MNKVIILGNLTRDPELKEFDGGNSLAKFGLAVNRTWKNKDGETQEKTTFVDVNVWGAAAGNCAKYLEKGRKVLVEGRLEMETWESKEGEKRSKHSINAENVQFLGGKNEDGGTPSEKSGKSKPKKKEPVVDDDFDEEVPF